MAHTPTATGEKWAGLLQRNKDFLATGAFEKPVSLAQVTSLVKSHDYKSIYILTCSDSRVEPAEIFQLKKGEANIIRCAGGKVTGENSDIFRSLSVMSTIAPIGIFIVMHHTDCGGLFRTDEEVKRILGERNPEFKHDIENVVFGTFGHIGIDESIRQDVERVKAWPFLGGAEVLGYAYETETGEVRKVC